LFNHEKKDYSERETEFKPILPSRENANINFDVTSESDLRKTVWYPFICYADFETSTKDVDGKSIQLPIAM
jgi:hypothetical protein